MVDSNFVNELMNKIYLAISEGCLDFVILGINSNSIKILCELYKNGLNSHIKAIIENEKPIRSNFFNIPILDYNNIQNVTYDAIIVPYDREKEEILENLIKYEKRVIRLIIAGNENYSFNDEVFYKILTSCSVKPKSGGYENMIIHIYQSLKYLSECKKYGDVAEFGVFQGGTTVFIAKTLEFFKNPSKIYGFDTFSGFPPPKSPLDLFCDKKYELTDFNTVKIYCSPYNIELIKGDIVETCKILEEKKLSFVFFDTDNYSATKKALEICCPQIISGGIISFDHYFSPTWLETVGEKIAIKQTLNQYDDFINLYGTGIFIKM